MKQLNTFDYIAVVTYMLMMVGIGLYFTRFMKGDSDYFRAGNRLTWWIGGLSAFMSGFSAYMFTAGAGVVYQEGVTGALILFMTGIAIFLGYLVFAKLWRRTRVTTIIQFMEHRFNRTSHQVASWIYIPMNILYCGVALYALSIFVASALGMEIYTVIWFSGLVIVAYTLMGGLWAVCVTDAVQFLFLMPVALLMVPMSLSKLDHLGDLYHSAPAGYYTLGTENHPWYWLVVFFLLLAHGQNTNPIVQRYFSVRDEAEARKVSLMCSLLFILGIITWAVPPMVARIVYPDIGAMIDLPNPNEGAFVVMAMELLPHGLMGIMVSAIFAAAMSAIDSQYNAISGVITKDICQKLIGKNLDQKILLRIGQLSTLVVGLLVIALSLSMAGSGEGSFHWMVKLSSLGATPLATPILLGFLYRRAPGWSFLISFLASGTVSMLFAFYPPMGDMLSGFSAPMAFTVQSLAIFLTGAATFFLSPFFYKPSNEERRRIDGFFKLLDTPVDTETELGDTAINNASIARFIGLMAIVIGLLVSSFVFIPGTLTARMLNLGIGFSLGGFGMLLYYISKRVEV